jgi:hypothetical protein
MVDCLASARLLKPTHELHLFTDGGSRWGGWQQIHEPLKHVASFKLQGRGDSGMRHAGSC